MRLLREPLLHFLLLGALLFAFDAALREAPPPVDVIRITNAEIDRLRTQWTNQYRRPPAPAELHGLVHAGVREEVLYREALAMGLDEDDSVVRRRLAQKLEFLIEDLAAAREPSEAELSALRAAPSSLPAAGSRLVFPDLLQPGSSWPRRPTPVSSWRAFGPGLSRP
jgi:hypothetical protein